MGQLSKNEADKWFADHSISDIKIFPDKDVVSAYVSPLLSDGTLL